MQDTVQDKLTAAALHRLEVLRKNEAFDPHKLDSRPTPKQQQVFDDFGSFKQQWIRAGNQSGKSQTCARILTWVLTDTHPTWKKPRDWGEQPLLAIVAGRTGKQIEDSLLPKIRSYLQAGTYKEVRIGLIIQRLELTNGNRIVFQSLEQPNQARERLQSYVADITWCDELPPTMDLVRELQIRTQARDGYSLWSFTPTVMNIEIQRYVDGLQEPEGRVYRFNMLDNPLYANEDRKRELLARYEHLSEEKKKMIFEGEWLSGDDQVYYFDYASMVELPIGYSPLWRHVEAVDPALKSALGLTLWAENPDTLTWYCVLAEYVKGILVPTDLVKHVNEITKKYNVVRRIADPHEVWYIQTASSMGISYMGVYKKNERKSELIKQLQEFLGPRIRISPTCEGLIHELQECRWSDKSDGRIVNGSSYHLLDSAHYFCDSIPKAEKKVVLNNWHAALLKANEERLKAEEQITRVKKSPISIRARGRRWK